MGRNSGVDFQPGQSGQSSLGGNLARKRYQKGYLFLRGKKQQVWVGRWLEDVIGPDNKTIRIHKSEVIGTKADFPTKRLAQRELDIRLSRINSLSYQPQKVVSFADFAERWKRNVMSNYKPSTKSGMKSSVNRWLVPQFGELRLHQITTEMLQQFLSSASVKPKTVRNPIHRFQADVGYGEGLGLRRQEHLRRDCAAIHECTRQEVVHRRADETDHQQSQ
jgi:Phage integrase, N-terminal SAM-like domain